MTTTASAPFAFGTALVATLALALAGGCTKEPAETAPIKRVDPGQTPKNLLPPKARDEVPVTDSAVRSIFPASVKTSKVAKQLCNGFQTLQRKRKGQCCNKSVGALLTTECTRVMSGALRAKTVVANEAKVDACLAAVEQSFEGCGWVGDFTRELPKECAEILSGTLDDGAACRSGLECKSGLACHGVSPTTKGTCGAPGKAGASCGRGIDPAATYLNISLLDNHPACEGFCANGRCRAQAKAGERCVSDASCIENLVCDPTPKKDDGKNKACVAGVRTLPEDFATTPIAQRCELKAFAR